MKNDPKAEPGLPRTGSDWFGPQPEPSDATLPPPVQEHLAQQLRAAYQETAEKPAFLGDPALPPELERKVAEIANREREAVREKAHHVGVEAVEAALQEVASGAVAPAELAPKPAAPAAQRPRVPTRS